MPSALIYTIRQDSKGYIWIGTAHGGVCRYDGIDFETFTKQDGLPSNSVCKIMEDSFGNLWFGTSSGLCRYDGEKFQNFLQEWKDEKPIIIQDIIERKSGEIWVSTESQGVLRYDGERLETVISPQKGEIIGTSSHKFDTYDEKSKDRT